MTLEWQCKEAKDITSNNSMQMIKDKAINGVNIGAIKIFDCLYKKGGNSLLTKKTWHHIQ